MSQPVHNCYDIIIVGAGPAGLSAGLHTMHRKDLSILLIDKTIPWRNLIPCAEGVGKVGFEEAVKVKKSWIRQEIRKAYFHAPDRQIIEYSDKNGGYIINRAHMQEDIAEELQQNGVECLYNTKVLEILAPDKGYRSVKLGQNSTIKAKVVIDASGPIGCFCKTENITWKPLDLEPALFVHVEGITIPIDAIHIYAGREIAPGGYAWVFPRGENAANIGIVIGRDYITSTPITQLLSRFLKDHFPSVRLVRQFAGTIPCSFKKGQLALPGLFKTGDAASTINPISRAGISEALLSGGLAGESALLMLEAHEKREILRICNAYQNEWNTRRGNRHTKLARVKNSLLSVPDEDYNKGAQALSSIPREEMTMSKIFRASLNRFPRLVWAMRHLM